MFPWADNLVPERDQLACPVVRRCTSLHADEAGRELAEEIEHLSATKAHLRDPPTLGICRVDLKDLLGDVEANNANLHGDGSCSKWTTPRPLWHADAGCRGRPPHQRPDAR